MLFRSAVTFNAISIFALCCKAHVIICVILFPASLLWKRWTTVAPVPNPGEVRSSACAVCFSYRWKVHRTGGFIVTSIWYECMQEGWFLIVLMLVQYARQCHKWQIKEDNASFLLLLKPILSVCCEAQHLLIAIPALLNSSLAWRQLRVYDWSYMLQK